MHLHFTAFQFLPYWMLSLEMTEKVSTQCKLCSIIKIITGQDFEKVIRNVPHYSRLTEFIFDPTPNLVLTQHVCWRLSPSELERPDLKPVWYIVKTPVYALVLQVLIREEAYVSGVVHSKPWNGAYAPSIYLRIRPWLWEAYAALVAVWELAYQFPSTEENQL